MTTGGYNWPFAPPKITLPSDLQCVNYDSSQQDPTAAPEKQAKVALDNAVASGSVDQLRLVLEQIGQHLPNNVTTSMMHALRTVARQGNLPMMQFLLEQIRGLPHQQFFEFMKYALDGAAAQDNPGMIDFLLGIAQEVFRATYPQQFLELVQHTFNAVATQGNLVLLKYLMDHPVSTALPINYDTVFGNAVARGKGEPLLTGAIQGGAHYEKVILMLLQSVKNLPDNNDSRVGSRQSFKNTAKIQVVKSYKQKDPALFATLMTAIKSYFPEESEFQGADSAMCM